MYSNRSTTSKHYTYLSRCFSLNVAFEDLFGPGGHLEGGLNLFVVLTHQPELNVLIAELRLQKGLKRHHAI